MVPSLYTEIFLAEPYFFQTGKEHPIIIDGGVNIGVSTAYFKWLYPSSRIIGFEPHPAVYEVAKHNIERNNMNDVELVKGGLAADEGTAQLYVVPQRDKASTLTKRLATRGVKPDTIPVDTVRLSGYITEEIDFLKLDIEGTELQVIEEIEDYLESINRMFIEFHYTYGDTENRLAPLLDILDRHNYVYLLASAMYVRRDMAVASSRNCSPISSVSIFVTKKGL
jgi:FkbM family methyltransferase